MFVRYTCIGILQFCVCYVYQYVTVLCICSLHIIPICYVLRWFVSHYTSMLVLYFFVSLVTSMLHDTCCTLTFADDNMWLEFFRDPLYIFTILCFPNAVSFSSLLVYAQFASMHEWMYQHTVCGVAWYMPVLCIICISCLEQSYMLTDFVDISLLMLHLQKACYIVLCCIVWKHL